ncbi:hypothetical protein LCGC14_1763870 [marine sediment metagenome]|uniref:Uncharacterized protein n=1 Tax=marine sediment metagenome TaxID=412755 RepID=A0A0F9H070_9ZZZZ
MVKYYRRNGAMKLLTISSGFLGLLYCFWGILGMHFTYDSLLNLFKALVYLACIIPAFLLLLK